MEEICLHACWARHSPGWVWVQPGLGPGRVGGWVLGCYVDGRAKAACIGRWVTRTQEWIWIWIMAVSMSTLTHTHTHTLVHTVVMVVQLSLAAPFKNFSMNAWNLRETGLRLRLRRFAFGYCTIRVLPGRECVPAYVCWSVCVCVSVCICC